MFELYVNDKKINYILDVKLKQVEDKYNNSDLSYVYSNIKGDYLVQIHTDIISTIIEDLKNYKHEIINVKYILDGEVQYSINGQIQFLGLSYNKEISDNWLHTMCNIIGYMGVN